LGVLTWLNTPLRWAKISRETVWEGDLTMSDRPPGLGRGLFGYKRSAVEEAISVRDVMLRQIEARVQVAEANTARLEAELAALRESNAQLERQVHDLTPAAEPDGLEGAEVTGRFVHEELATVLSAAEESAGRIIVRARESTQRQVAEADRLWRDARSRYSRFSDWRDRVQPVLDSAQSKIDEVRTRIEEIPDQIRQALSPLAESVASLDGRLAEVSGTATSLPGLSDGNPVITIGEGGESIEGIEIMEARGVEAAQEVPAQP
jgi:hypothetical protein